MTDAGEVNTTVRPALKKLESDHNALVEELYEPFETRERLISWMVKANVRTLGVIDPEFFVGMYKDRLNLASFLGRKVGSCEASEGSMRYCQDLHADAVSKACRLAYQIFRKNAGQYFDDVDFEDFEDGDVALRPALQEAEERQLELLIEARTGFESRKELQSWLRRANAAAEGELVDEIDAFAPVFSWEAGELLASPGDILWSRDLVLIETVLPAFIRSIRILRDRATEHLDDGEDYEVGMGDHIGV